MTIDRRTTLAGLAAAGLNGSRSGAAAASPGDIARTSPFGGWSTDAHRLPAYVFAGDVPVQTSTPAGRRYPLEPDPVFLLGNSDLTLFAFASGRLLFVSGERGWVRLNEAIGTAPGHAARLTVIGDGVSATHDLLGAGGVCASGARATRLFGCGTARLLLRPQPGLTVERILSVPPSVGEARAPAAVVVTIRLTNSGPSPLDLDYVETVLSNPTLLPSPPPAGAGPKVKFVNTARPSPCGVGVLCDAVATSDDPNILVPIDTPSSYNLYPPSLLLTTAASAGGAPVVFTHSPVEGDAVELTARSRVRLAPGGSRDIVLVVALKSPQADVAPLERFAAALPPSPAGDWFRRDWGRVLAPLAAAPDAALRAELQWDGHALLAMATYAAYYRQTFIPQGMTYDYVLDLNSGPRDHLQHAMGAAYFAPDLARSSILYTLCAMTPEGAIKFTVSGNGMTADSSWSPSDQQLFLFYAIGEYLRITRDWSFLEAQTDYLPGGPDRTGTVLDKIDRAFAYLRDHVSTGPHGLVRLLTGDWNDQIYAGVPEGQYRDTAESQMNSAMAMAIIPPLVAQLRAYARMRRSDQAAAVHRLAAAMDAYAARIERAMMRDMEGRSFARRAWLAPGEALGDTEMYLEPQSFLLQAPAFPLARKRALLREIRRRLMDGETLGPRQRETPSGRDRRMAAGTSENGGFWYALSGQAIAGVATFDGEAAMDLLHRMTFRNFSRRHPGYWVGRWTAPDTLNAELCGDLAGLPRPMDDGVFCKMAAYCAHAHAWPIYSYFRIRDAARSDARARGSRRR